MKNPTDAAAILKVLFGGFSRDNPQQDAMNEAYTQADKLRSRSEEMNAAVKAKDLNLGALISDALTKLKLQQNKDKIKDLDKPVKKEDLESDPKKVEDFYKNRK